MTDMIRTRRLRRTGAIRRMVAETRLHPSMFVLPLFVTSGTDVVNPIPPSRTTISTSRRVSRP